MARVKDALGKSRKATRHTWTRFQLPLGQGWPIWPRNYADKYHGPLKDVAGVGRTSLGRMVEDPEQAVFVIPVAGWESTEALAAFRLSALCGSFLGSLGRSEDDDDDDALLTFRWDYGFLMHKISDKLFGRVTLNILRIPFTGAPDYD
ncbi:hypothetical protein F4802DRAFT_600630 [Xylaria palmicola]|nr:hypothetical protein F4802DRAFT_600630 [Xylaria palmicola]